MSENYRLKFEMLGVWHTCNIVCFEIEYLRILLACAMQKKN